MTKENKNIVRFYFDQNILDSFLKNRLTVFKKLILDNENYKVIYSYPTLNEFERINDAADRNKFLELLEEFEAEYYWIDDNELAQFTFDDPKRKYSQIIEENIKFKPVMNSMELFLHKLMGGHKGTSMTSIIKENRDTLNDLMEILSEELQKFQADTTITKDIIDNIIPTSKKEFSFITEGFFNEFNKNVKNELEYEGIKDFQKFLSIGPLRLNNVTPPNVINKIWEVVKFEAESKNINITYDDLFGEKIWSYFPTKNISIVEKINGLYNLLNFLGYHSEPQLHKTKKFNTFISDTQHSGHAAYAHFLVSSDERFVKKTEAVYEHFNIGTRIIFLNTV